MKFHKFAYDKFYEQLYKIVRKNELTEDEAKNIGKKSADMWEYKIKGQTVFEKAFPDCGGDSTKFYRLRGEIRSSPRHYEEVYTDLVTAGLAYIGIVTSAEFDEKYFADADIKLQVLYQIYLESNFPGFLKSNPHYKLYNAVANMIPRIEAIRGNPEYFDDFTLYERSNDEQANYQGMNINVVKLINDFYQNISDTKYLQAWESLAPAFQKRVWKDDYKAFEISYVNTISISNVQIFDPKSNNQMADYKVYYEDTVTVSSNLELATIEKFTVANIDIFVEKVKHLQKSASELGLKDFDKIELVKFFNPSLSEYIWYKNDMNPDCISEMLPTKETITIPRLQSVTCAYSDGKWLIKNIASIKSRLIK